MPVYIRWGRNSDSVCGFQKLVKACRGLEGGTEEEESGGGVVPTLCTGYRWPERTKRAKARTKRAARMTEWI